MLSVKRFVTNMFAENTYVVSDSLTHEAAVIDAGMLFDDEWQEFDAYIADNRLKVTHLLNTHLHIDHLFGNDRVCSQYGVVIEASAADEPLLKRCQQQAAMFGIKRQLPDLKIGKELHDGDEIALGASSLRVIATPGHSLGGLSFYSKTDQILFTGDTLFRCGIGRTDLPGGNYSTLIHSIIERLLVLPDDTIVYPGHDAPSTIGEERRFNPYL